MTDNPTYTYIDVKLKNVKAKIALNGKVIVENAEGETINSTEMVNLWVLPKGNKLSVNLNPIDENSTVMPRVEIFVYLHDNKKEFPTPQKIYAKYDYAEELEKNSELKLPVSVTREMNFDYVIPTKIWGVADSIKSLSDGDKNEIIALVNGLEKSILEKNVDNVVKYFKYKISEDASAEGKTFERLKEVTTEDFNWAFSQGDLASDGNSLNLKNAEFSLCCANRILHVGRKTGLDAISITSPKLSLDMEVGVAKINGSWVIVR